MPPVPTAHLADLLPVASGIWRPQYQQETSIAGGELLAADLGPMLWVADVRTPRLELNRLRQLRARLLSVDGSLGAFYYTSPEALGPQADPRGTILGEAEVEIESIGADNRSIAFRGLPAGYVLTVGDMFHVDYGSPSRRALFALTADGLASGLGVTSEIGVRPHVRPGILAGTAVTLIRPAAKVKIRPAAS